MRHFPSINPQIPLIGKPLSVIALDHNSQFCALIQLCFKDRSFSVELKIYCTNGNSKKTENIMTLILRAANYSLIETIYIDKVTVCLYVTLFPYRTACKYITHM